MDSVLPCIVWHWWHRRCMQELNASWNWIFREVFCRNADTAYLLPNPHRQLHLDNLCLPPYCWSMFATQVCGNIWCYDLISTHEWGNQLAEHVLVSRMTVIKDKCKFQITPKSCHKINSTLWTWRMVAISTLCSPSLLTMPNFILLSFLKPRIN